VINNANFVPFKNYNTQLDCVAGPRTLHRVVFNVTSNSTQNITIIDHSSVIVSGSDGHAICANGHSIGSTEGVRVQLRGLNFTHCGLASVPTWQQQLAHNSTRMEFDGNLFDGRSVATAPPMTGVFDNGFVLRENEFFGYIGFNGLQLEGRTCDATRLTLDRNHFEDFEGSVFAVSQVQSYRLLSNLAIRSGGSVANPPYVMYAEACDDTNGGLLEVDGNRVRQANTPTYSNRIAGIWLKNINYDHKKVSIRQNCVDPTLDIGMNFENMPGSDRAHLRSLSLADENICAQGSWHDLVEGDAASHAVIDANPEATKRHYCDNGCTGDDLMPLGYTLAALAVVFLGGGILYGACFARKRPASESYQSQFLRTEVTVSNEWPQLSSQPSREPLDEELMMYNRETQPLQQSMY
jgi:hypothetical protein